MSIAVNLSNRLMLNSFWSDDDTRKNRMFPMNPFESGEVWELVWIAVELSVGLCEAFKTCKTKNKRIIKLPDSIFWTMQFKSSPIYGTQSIFIMIGHQDHWHSFPASSEIKWCKILFTLFSFNLQSHCRNFQSVSIFARLGRWSSA